jgi:hypothetical protein
MKSHIQGLKVQSFIFTMQLEIPMPNVQQMPMTITASDVN